MKMTNQSIYFLLRTKVLALTLLFAAVAFSCDDEDDSTPPAQQTVLDIAVANDNFDVLAAAAVRAGTGVTNVLSGTTQITVFAPTDAAFVTYLNVANEAAAITAVNGLTPAAAADLLTFHVISGSEIKAANIAAGNSAVTTARGTNNNKAFVTKTGSNVTINNARVTTADVDASNGVIHIIDAVLTPPTGNIVEIAVANTELDILAAAVTKAGLATNLQAAGPLTVFAPTDAAFLTLLRSAAFYNNPDLTETQAITAIDGLTETGGTLPLATLRQILLYHVVSGSNYSINLTNGSVATLKADAPKNVTIGGVGSVSITVTGSAAGATASSVVIANVSANNGVAHVIDKVLLP
jgi:uncharacterized surface protein with fasciclin (FAS1) repeats